MRVRIWALGLAVVIGGLSMSGCAQTMWIKAGYTPQQFETDKFDCDQRVMMMYGGLANMDFGSAIMARQQITRCMMTKGYREATAEEYEQNARLSSR